MSSETPRRNSTWWVGGWLAPLLVTGFTIFWALIIYLLIGSRPVTWNYGAAQYVPGSSIFSTQPKPTGPPPRQVVLPEKTTGGANAKP